MNLSLKKYITTALKWLIPFACMELLICILYFTDVANEMLFAMINVIDFVMLLLPGAYYLIMFFVYRKKCTDITPKDGIIANWESGFFRYTGALIVKEDDKEYSTAAYFNSEEAKEMVGKTVSYAIIDETLIVFEIKE